MYTSIHMYVYTSIHMYVYTSIHMYMYTYGLKPRDLRVLWDDIMGYDIMGYGIYIYNEIQSCGTTAITLISRNGGRGLNILGCGSKG